MIIIFIIMGLWFFALRSLSLTYREKNEEIDLFLQLMARIRFGVCEQRLGLLEILQMKQEPLFGEIECVGLSSYARSRQETLGLSESTLTKLRRFEEQTAVASSVECAALINEVSTLASSELEEQRRQLKNRSTGAYTVLTALMLILIIILI